MRSSSRELWELRVPQLLQRSASCGVANLSSNYVLKRPSGPRPSEHTAHTYIHTPFSHASGVLLDVMLSFFRFPIWPPEPQVPATGSRGWRGFVNQHVTCITGSCSIGREPIECTKCTPFPVLLCGSLLPKHISHIRASAFHFYSAKGLLRTPA